MFWLYQIFAGSCTLLIIIRTIYLIYYRRFDFWIMYLLSKITRKPFDKENRICAPNQNLLLKKKIYYRPIGKRYYIIRPWVRYQGYWGSPIKIYMSNEDYYKYAKHQACHIAANKKFKARA